MIHLLGKQKFKLDAMKSALAKVDSKPHNFVVTAFESRLRYKEYKVLCNEGMMSATKCLGYGDYQRLIADLHYAKVDDEACKYDRLSKPMREALFAAKFCLDLAGEMELAGTAMRAGETHGSYMTECIARGWPYVTKRQWDCVALDQIAATNLGD